MDSFDLDFHLDYNPEENTKSNDAVLVSEMLHYQKVFMLQSSDLNDIASILEANGEPHIAIAWSQEQKGKQKLSIKLDDISDDVMNEKKAGADAKEKFHLLSKMLNKFIEITKSKYGLNS